MATIIEFCKPKELSRPPGMGSAAAMRESAAIPQKPHWEYINFSSYGSDAN
jgi:hypothetical protein